MRLTRELIQKLSHFKSFSAQANYATLKCFAGIFLRYTLTLSRLLVLYTFISLVNGSFRGGNGRPFYLEYIRPPLHRYTIYIIIARALGRTRIFFLSLLLSIFLSHLLTFLGKV